jgi:hypothetical protein
MTTLLDTGPLVAYLYQGDTHHDWVTQQADELSPPLYSCEAVLSEAHFLLSGPLKARKNSWNYWHGMSFRFPFPTPTTPIASTS